MKITEAEKKWYFKRWQLIDSPSHRCGIDSDKELLYRQQMTNYIQDMGQRLIVKQQCINTAIVYMHRFFMVWSFTKVQKHDIASACFFLASKVEEQPRKMVHIIRVIYAFLRNNSTPIDVKSEEYIKDTKELLRNESVLLQTLNFEITVDHPHTHVLKACRWINASRDLMRHSYFFATNSLQFTSFCLQYRPSVVACFCIHIACKWGSWEIPPSEEHKNWFTYVDESVTMELLEELIQDFLRILEKCPSRIKQNILANSSARASQLKHLDEDKNGDSNSSFRSPNLTKSKTADLKHHNKSSKRKIKSAPHLNDHTDSEFQNRESHKMNRGLKVNSLNYGKEFDDNQRSRLDKTSTHINGSNHHIRNGVDSVSNGCRSSDGDMSKPMQNGSNFVSEAFPSISKEPTTEISDSQNGLKSDNSVQPISDELPKLKIKISLSELRDRYKNDSSTESQVDSRKSRHEHKQSKKHEFDSSLS